ncbi:hypothetical protein LJR296_003367 [Cupriavidus necator]|uniref:hypothetical protein n=1 Tax=Cupriavidus necator TaxID=106590 RepID=UPI003ECD126C
MVQAGERGPAVVLSKEKGFDPLLIWLSAETGDSRGASGNNRGGPGRVHPKRRRADNDRARVGRSAVCSAAGWATWDGKAEYLFFGGWHSRRRQSQGGLSGLSPRGWRHFRYAGCAGAPPSSAEGNTAG